MTSDAERHELPTGRIVIGDWTVDLDLNRIRSNGATTQLQPRIMDVLRCLAASPGRVVSKQRLLDQVWQCEFVAENSLTHAIAELRAAFGDDARQPRYIETIPKRGYRLIADVSPGGSRSRNHRDRFPRLRHPVGSVALLSAAALCLILTARAVFAIFGLTPASRSTFPAPDAPAPPRVVVLPFEHLGPEDARAFTAGMTDELTDRLARISGLVVISRTSAFGYDREGKTVAALGADLGVDYIVEGSVRWDEELRDEAQVRITPRLVRVADDVVLWNDSYTRRVSGVFDVQGSIGAEVVDHLGVTLRRAERRALDDGRASDADAYRYFLWGRSLMYSDEESDYRDAITNLTRAVELDPTFARAWAELSVAHGRMIVFWYDPSEERFRLAREAVDRANALDPDLPEVARARGLYAYHCERDYSAALRELEAAARELPNDSTIAAEIAYVQRRMGRWDESVAGLERVVRLDPLNPSPAWNLAISYEFVRRYDDANALFDRVLTISPGFRSVHLHRASIALLRDGETQVARGILEEAPGPRDARWLRIMHQLDTLDGLHARALERVQDSPTPHWGGLPVSHRECLDLSALGRTSEAAVVCSDALASIHEKLDADPESPALLLAVADIHAARGDHSEALRFARRAETLWRPETDAVSDANFEAMLADFYLLVGDTNAAIDHLDRVLSMPARMSLDVIRHTARWAPVRDNPRFQELLRRHAAPEDRDT